MQSNGRGADTAAAVLEAFRDLGQWLRGQGANAQWALAWIEQAGPARIGSLAQSSGLDASSVSRQVQALVDEGLVRRTPDPNDGRAHLVEVTDAGRERLAAGRKAVADQLAARLPDWDPDELERFAATLRRFAHDLCMSGQSGQTAPHLETAQHSTEEATL